MYDELVIDLADRVSQKCIQLDIPFDNEDLQSIVCVMIGIYMIEGCVTLDRIESAIRMYFTLFIESK